MASIGDIGMVCGNAVAAGMKHKRFAFVVLVVLDLTQKDNVITSIVLSNLAADELSNHALENRNTGALLAKLNPRKLIGQWGRELPRQVMLMRFQYVDGEVTDIREISEARRLA